MNKPPESRRYPALSIYLHWLTLLLIIAVYAFMEFRGIYPRGSAGREWMKHWHFMLGLLVFVLAALRLVARSLLTVPPVVPAPPRWQQYAARAMHVGLYAFLIAMPLLGWATLSAKGSPAPFFGLELPALGFPDKGRADTLEEIHERIATLGYYLIGLHALAALFHHYIMRDNVMRRMMPRGSRQAG